MLVATFGPTTTWAGKTVTYADGAFVLEGHGPISAKDVFEYGRQSHLVWSMDGIRAWVGARAQAEGGPAAAPSQSAEWQAEPPAAAALGLSSDASRILQPATPIQAHVPAVVPGPAEGPAVEELTANAVPSVATIDDAFSGLGADDPARARAIEEAAREHEWTRLADLYELQAWWLDEEGRDALQVTRLARRAELRALSERGVALVGVTAADEESCAACRRVGGRVMTVADALRLMPIPNASCAYEWCRCRWKPAEESAPR